MHQPRAEGTSRRAQILELRNKSKQTKCEFKEYSLLQFYIFGNRTSVKEIAQTLNVSERSVRDLSNGWPLEQRVDISEVRKICTYFQCTVEQMIVPLSPAQAENLHRICLGSVLQKIASASAARGSALR